MAVIGADSTRRHFLRGLGLIIASPTIVRMASLMPLPRKRIRGISAWGDIITIEEPVERIVQWQVEWHAIGRLRVPNLLVPESKSHASRAGASSVPAAAQISPQSGSRLVGEAS
jgi:hypothetical protein